MMGKYVLLAIVMFTVLAVTECCDLNINIDCSSHGYQYKTCKINSHGAYNDIKLIRKYSRSRCTKGVSYGVKQDHVWVDKGCRGKFGVCVCRKYRVIDCDSRGYKYKECAVSGASNVIYIQLASKRSRSACNKNSSYGINGNKIWVDHGCRGRFHVCYK